MNKIRVLIIDDSALIRKMLTEIINTEHDIEVIGTAPDPIIAREKIKKLNPDVLTLDVEMPRMDGLTFLRNLMRLRPMPVVMISTLTEQGAEVTMDALALGAVDFVAKPKVDVAQNLQEYSEDILAKVRIAAKANVRQLDTQQLNKQSTKQNNVTVKHSTDVVLQSGSPGKHFKTTGKIIALGASTGGTEAIKEVISGLPNTTPAVVISQHLPAAFSDSFAKHVDMITQMSVCIVRDRQQILPGHVYIAPGDQHLLIVRDGARYIGHLHDGPPVNRHKPSVDVMFRSVAQNVGVNALGVLLTGMGADGAKGMKEMHDAGAKTVIQDEASSVVWGMPGEAFKLGCADHVLALDKVAGKILSIIE